MSREKPEVIYARVADIDTSWMGTFNTDMIGGFMQNGISVRVIPERKGPEGYRPKDVFDHKLRVLESFSQMDISDEDTLFVSCPLRCALDQLVWVSEVVKQRKPLVACYSLTGTFIKEDWITVFTPWVRHLERMWYEKSDLIFVPTEYYKQAMLQDGYNEDKIFVVGAPVDSKKISTNEEPRDKNLIVFNHRLNGDKKPAYFLRLVEDLSTQFPQLKFGISTNLNESDFWSTMDQDLAVSLKDALAKFTSLRIIFNPSRDEYFSLLNQAYLAPCFATHETFGFSVAESLAAGCLPVVPARLTYPELVDGDEDLMCTSTGDLEVDYQAALKKMIYFIQNPQLGGKKSLEVRSYVNRFSPVNVVGRILDILNKHSRKEVKYGDS
ncbi:glycosyltransferase [Patescibacteria group bacterium]|nr:glycosyltransferase [Patescibacteria group bacterium]